MGKKAVKKGIRDFNLDHIFDCGQCFRWEKQKDGSYTGVAFGKVVSFSFDEKNGTLTIDNASEEDFQNIWRNYLDLDRDYGKIKKMLSRNDEVMRKATEYGYGIRILNQEKWETLISFIISQNNNIPRIKKCIENLAINFGEKAGIYKGKDYYNLPTVEKLASLSVEDLEPIHLGYRARYLIDTAKKVQELGGEGALENLCDDCYSCQTAQERITKFPGVGPKVANCILLFCMNRYDSFPIDVWIARLMNKFYGIDESDKASMESFAKERFGKLGGFAQQYLFYYGRGN